MSGSSHRRGGGSCEESLTKQQLPDKTACAAPEPEIADFHDYGLAGARVAHEEDVLQLQVAVGGVRSVDERLGVGQFTRLPRGASHRTRGAGDHG